MTPTSSERPPTDTRDITPSVLSHPTRRHVVATIGEATASDEFELDDLLPGEDDRKHEVITLHHWHLPKLDEAGYLDWNWRAGIVRRGPRFNEIQQLVSSASPEESP